MARNRHSRFEEMIELASFLPWWLCLFFAIAGYVLFHYISLIELAPVAQPSEAIGISWKQIFKTLSLLLQFIVPIIFALGAIISAARQWKRKRIFGKQESLETVKNLSWQAFELLISEAFRQKGYKVSETEDGPDGGVDLILRKDNRTFFVQCKHWKKSKVGVREVRELKGIVAEKNIYNGILVTSGVYTTEAIEFADNSGIELIDGSQLIQLLPNLKTQPKTWVKNKAPMCPQCGNSMIKRVAKHGKRVGKSFWGCSTFPKCRGVINID